MKYEQLSLFEDSRLTKEPPYLLISVKEPWVKKILDGEKKYEYRRIFIEESSRVFIYASGKIKGICAFAEFEKPIIGTVEEIALINAKDVNPNRDGIYRYFGNRKKCFAIPIKNYQRMETISLDDLRLNFDKFSPPQSYIYLKNKPKLLDFLLKAKKVSRNKF
ncbi:MAG: hypothetical protein OMM_11183 [Candidatus Magnetoglobus multicellularis str. Araruama]|uniref:ASCH domain-containing protein n=1 Tax=Candidatus Magnetoglobus multicellularis str. Araruama TaxID=890399 RepID=A0A1V1NZ25_9BACT|nr:MAG: hypothetical protein OMM_11183 [Candidatus Magnetoglobus multicellularis str. Araruama]